MLLSILMLIRQVNEGRAEVENEFTRAVSAEGNVKAIELMDEVFERRPTFEWRGLGTVPNSALRIRPEFAEFDAEKRFVMPELVVPDNKEDPAQKSRRFITAGKEKNMTENNLKRERASSGRRLDILRGAVEMTHGSGGRASAQLIGELFARHLTNEWLDQGHEGAVMPPISRPVAVSRAATSGALPSQAP